MRRNLFTTGFILFATAAGIAPLTAQDRGIVEVGSISRPSTRGGLYGSLGIGAGSERYKFSDEPHFTEALTKPTLSLRLGGTPSERVRVGGEIFAWGNDINGGIESFTMLMVTGQFFLMKDGGLFLRGGGGFARSGTDYDDGGSAHETGFGTSLGVGWDLKVGRNFFISPAIDWYEGKFNKRNEPTLTERVVNVGIHLTLQSGNKR